jgi:hypothetical protein
VILFLSSLVLGNIGLLDKQYYRAVHIVVMVVLTLFSLRSLPQIFTSIISIRYRPRWIDLIIAGCFFNALRIVLIALVCDWTFGTSSFDSLNYHIPRALVWSWQGSLAPYPTNIWQQLGHAYGGAGTVLPIVFLGCGWLGGAFPTVIFSLGCVVAVLLLGLKAGLSARAALVGALALMFCPTLGMRLVDTSTDVAAAFPVLAVMAMSWRNTRLNESLFLYPALVGLGVSAKQYVLFPAIPVALVLFAPHIKRIVCDIKSILSGTVGVLVSFVFMGLSFVPIKAALGDFTGNGNALTLSNFQLGWWAVGESLILVILEWSLEFVRGFSQPTRAYLYNDLGLGQLFSFCGFDGYRGILDTMHKEQVRGGFFSLLLLPWLFFAVPKERRLQVLLFFVVIFVAQFGPLSVNGSGARFAIIPVALFCVLFGARAQSSMGLTALLLLLISFPMVRFSTPGGHMEIKWPGYLESNEVNRDLFAIVGGDKVSLLGRSLSQDASVAGRLAQVHFEYFTCPADGNWARYFEELKKTSRWVLFSPPSTPFIPGPNFPTTLGPECQRISSEEFKSALTQGGWSLQKLVVRDYELWGHAQ